MERKTKIMEILNKEIPQRVSVPIILLTGIISWGFLIYQYILVY